jgi:hypothetical protein
MYSHFRLGNNISGEVNGKPSAGANLDTADDGVVIEGDVLGPGDNVLIVTVAGVGGALTGWIDWNNSGTFDESERLTWRTEDGTVLGGEADLNPGTHRLVISSPGVDGQRAARFRWGEPGLSFSGPADIGEVEDYMLTSSSTDLFAGDYNDDGEVNMSDYVVWRRFNGSSTVLPNDITPGTVNQSDYDVWMKYFGMVDGAGAGAGAGGASQSAAEPSGAEASGGTRAAPAGLSPFAWSSFVRQLFSQALVQRNAANNAAQSAEVPESVPSVSPAAIDFAVSSVASSAGTSRFLGGAAASSSAAGSSDMLLLDQVLADLAVEEEDGPICVRDHQEDDSVGELELAAVFDDDTNWWSL